MPHEQRLVLSAYPWFVRCFGLIFAGFGIYGVIGMLTGLWPMTVTHGDGPSRPATPADVWLPGIFLIIGLGIACFRYSLVLDAGRRMRVQTLGWGFWVKRTETSLATATCIDLGAEERRGSGSGSYTAIPVRAVSPHGIEELASPQTLAKARQLAQRIAAALDLPIGPAVTGTPGLRRAEDADLPVSRLVQPDPADLRPPPDTRVRVEELPRGIEIRYPMQRAGLVGVAIGMILPLLFCGGFWWFAWRPGLVGAAKGSLPMTLFMLAPLLMGLIPALAMLVTAARSGALGGSIRVDTEAGLQAAGRTIPAADIRAIQILPGARLGGGLKVVLATSEFVIARGQPEADLRWIRALILKQL